MKKITAIILTLVISLQFFGLMSYAENIEYEGEVFGVINTSLENVESFSVYSKEYKESCEEEDTEERQEADSNNAEFDVINDINILSPEEAEKKEKEDTRSKAECKSENYKVGDTKEVDSYELMCIYVGEECTVWTQINDRDTDDFLEDADCIEIGKWFENMIPKELELLGDKRIDTDGDGKIAMLFHDIPGSTAGYVQYSDYIGKNGKIGNVWAGLIIDLLYCDCIHLDISETIHCIKSIAVHEYQHYIHFSYGYVGKNNITYFDPNSAVTEGFSTAAEYVLNDRHYYYDLLNSDSDSLLKWDSNYEIEFIFFQYVRTRYAQLIGDKSEEYPGKYVYKTILEKMDSNEHNGFRIAADLLYSESSYPELKTTEERLKRLITDFWTASMRQDPEGIYGFNGDEVSICIDRDIYNSLSVENLELKPGMASFFTINDGAKGTAVFNEMSSDDLVVITVNGLYKSMYYDLNDGNGPVRYYTTQNDRVLFAPYVDKYLFFDKSLKHWLINGEKYNSYDDVEANCDVIAYPVYEQAEEINTGKYSFDGTEYENKCYTFTPEVSGYYKLSFPEGDIEVYDSEGYYTCCSNWNYIEETQLAYHIYYLDAEEQYFIHLPRINLSKDDNPVYGESEFEIEYQEEHYKLTYDWNEYCYYEPEEYDGDVTYTINCLLFEESFYIETGKTFVGWSENKNATKPDYTAYETITINKDTTLYAVWEDIPKISLGVSEPNHGYYIFDVPHNGIYNFNADDEIDMYTLKCCRWSNSSIVEYFSAGERVLIYGSGVSIDDITDDFSSEIKYHILGNESAVFVQKCGYSKTVFDFKPISIMPGETFVGWTTDPESSEVEYVAGDEIKSAHNVELYPVFETKFVIENYNLSVLLMCSRVPTIMLNYCWFVIKNYLGFVEGTLEF